MRELPFIRFDREALFGRLVEEWLQKNRLKVTESMELDGLEAISSMVFANLGVSIVPRSCVKTVNPIPIRRLPLGVDAPTRLLGLAHRINSPKSDLIKQVHLALLKRLKLGSSDRNTAFKMIWARVQHVQIMRTLSGFYHCLHLNRAHHQAARPCH